jgi:hypothetical protein
LFEESSQFYPHRGALSHPRRSRFFQPSRGEQSHEREPIRRVEKLPMEPFLSLIQQGRHKEPALETAPPADRKRQETGSAGGTKNRGGDPQLAVL